jgi:hypothetical protein
MICNLGIIASIRIGTSGTIGRVAIHLERRTSRKSAKFNDEPEILLSR